jgi:hypothetical protein
VKKSVVRAGWGLGHHYVSQGVKKVVVALYGTLSGLVFAPRWRRPPVTLYLLQQCVTAIGHVQCREILRRDGGGRSNFHTFSKRALTALMPVVTEFWPGMV